MTENELRSEVKKAIDLYLEKTYEMTDFQNHMLQLIRDNSDTGTVHIMQLEYLIFKMQELRKNQRLFWVGHKSKLPVCKSQEIAIDKKLQYLISSAGYSIERYKNQPNQHSLFK